MARKNKALTLRVGEAVLISDGSGVASKVGAGVGAEDVGDGVLISDGSGVTGTGVGLQRMKMNKMKAFSYLTGGPDNKWIEMVVLISLTARLAEEMV